MRHRDTLDAAAPAYRRRIWAGSLLLAAAAAGLTFVAMRLDVPFSGFGAIVVTFGGLAWVSIAMLRRRFAQFELRRARK